MSVATPDEIPFIARLRPPKITNLLISLGFNALQAIQNHNDARKIFLYGMKSLPMASLTDQPNAR
jgi:hypothetical protein